MPELLRPELCGLYAITPEGLAPQVLLARVEAALVGGTTFVQYRDKSCDSAQRSELARALLGLCHRYNAQFLVNDDLALALAVGADGSRLGRGHQLPERSHHLGVVCTVSGRCNIHDGTFQAIQCSAMEACTQQGDDHLRPTGGTGI